MPMLRFDVIEGRSDAELQALLEAGYQAILSAFGVPTGDRYQIIQEHKRSHVIFEDTGLDIERTAQVVMVSVITRPRTEHQKTQFYFDLCNQLKNKCGIESSDVIVSIITNADADWSFGMGKAQFLTGEL